MPTYCYKVISTGEILEISHPISELPLQKDARGLSLQRIFTPPNISTKHTPAQEKKSTSNENLSRLGFTKYTRDKLTGQYHKEVGEGPNTLL